MSEEAIIGTPATVLPKKAKVGKPTRHNASRNKVAYPTSGGYMIGQGGNFYSPEMSPDFLELPQSIDEQRNYYRFFYDNEPFVGQAIDLMTELPLSKIRLQKPKARNKKLAEASMRFCEKWVRSIHLLQRLMEMLHDLNLIGEVAVFAEDSTPDMPREITHERILIMDEETGEVKESWRPHEDAKDREIKWLKKNYKGWTALRVLVPETLHIETFPFTDEILIQIVPDSKTRSLIERANQGDPNSIRIVESMPEEIVDLIQVGGNIPLNTNPNAGSFVHYMARKKSQYEPRGKSVLQRCMRTLVFRDKLRQAQTSIASRHMTPYRVVWAEDLNDIQVEELRAQVDLALQDPDYSIITNYQVNWEEKGGGAENRLLDLTSEYELTDRQLYAGLGVTESLLSGESSYSGDRINLEVINERFMLVRALMQDYVDHYLLEPMCARMGFIEEDEDGNEVIIAPKLTFTRLALRDHQETFDALFNLYSKGSLDIDTILDLLNLDPDAVREKVQRDLMTINDPLFNEILRSLYSSVGNSMAEASNAAEKIADAMGIDYTKKQEGMGRFASKSNPVSDMIDILR